jgi:uncharacterized protein YcbX
MITVSGLYVYPVKSCRGTALEQAEVVDCGFAFDRQWMVADAEGRFLSQRTQPKLARVDVRIASDALVISASGMPELRVSLDASTSAPRSVTIWRDTCLAESAGPRAARWFSEFLETGCELVRMPSTTRRPVDPSYAAAHDRVGFADGFPFLLLSQASLDELNRRLEAPVPMGRFRPNIVVTGCEPHAEDGWSSMRVADIDFRVVKPCARCVITTTDQHTGERSTEPLRTLASYRKVGGELLFGQNLIQDGRGSIHLGDPCEVRERPGDDG